jgi:hypothetical protein
VCLAAFSAKSSRSDRWIERPTGAPTAPPLALAGGEREPVAGARKTDMERGPEYSLARKEVLVAKGIEKAKKDNKPKLSTKEKQKKKKEKKSARS